MIVVAFEIRSKLCALIFLNYMFRGNVLKKKLCHKIFEKPRKKQKFDNIFDRFCLNHKPSYSNYFLGTRKQRNTNTVETNRITSTQPFVCKTLKSLQSFLIFGKMRRACKELKNVFFFSNWNNTQWSQFTVVGVFETFLCGCTCGWYKKESLDSWRGESSGLDPGDTRRRNYFGYVKKKTSNR
jgi:hypothetical protein